MSGWFQLVQGGRRLPPFFHMTIVTKSIFPYSWAIQEYYDWTCLLIRFDSRCAWEDPQQRWTLANLAICQLIQFEPAESGATCSWLCTGSADIAMGQIWAQQRWRGSSLSGYALRYPNLYGRVIHTHLSPYIHSPRSPIVPGRRFEERSRDLPQRQWGWWQAALSTVLLAKEVPYGSYSTGICCLTLGFDAVDSMVLWLMVARFFNNHHQNHDDIPHHELDLSLHGIPQVMTGVEKCTFLGWSWGVPPRRRMWI